MKRVSLQEEHLNPTFIGSWVMDTPSLCDRLIDYFEAHTERQASGTTTGGNNIDNKDRTDISISPYELNLPGNEIFRTYIDSLFECYKDYNLDWPFLSVMVDKLEIGTFNIGKYLPGQHFQKLHTERTSLNTLHRLFAFMTYLNDVEEGGSTYFAHYDLNVRPQKGLTLIWPAEWTHAHKGNKLIRGYKYIITGWLNFPTL